RSDYAADPATVSRGFLLPAGEATHTTTELLDQGVDAVRDYFSDRTPGGGRRNKQPLEAWVEGWARVIYDFDQYSVWGFLSRHMGLSDRTIQAIGTLENLTSRMALSFLHSFQELAVINAQATYWELEDGTWRLPYALLPMIEDEIRMDRRMTRIEYWDPTSDHSGAPRPPHVGPDGPT